MMMKTKVKGKKDNCYGTDTFFQQRVRSMVFEASADSPGEQSGLDNATTALAVSPVRVPQEHACHIWETRTALFS